MQQCIISLHWSDMIVCHPLFYNTWNDIGHILISVLAILYCFRQYGIVREVPWPCMNKKTMLASTWWCYNIAKKQSWQLWSPPDCGSPRFEQKSWLSLWQQGDQDRWPFPSSLEVSSHFGEFGIHGLEILFVGSIVSCNHKISLFNIVILKYLSKHTISCKIHCQAATLLAAGQQTPNVSLNNNIIPC